MGKRPRAPKAKPGEIVFRWGKLPGDAPDMCGAWQSPADKPTMRLVMNVFASQRLALPFADEEKKKKCAGLPYFFDIPFIDELENRGYDLTTLRFSIQKKTEPQIDVGGEGRGG